MFWQYLSVHLSLQGSTRGLASCRHFFPSLTWGEGGVGIKKEMCLRAEQNCH